MCGVERAGRKTTYFAPHAEHIAHRAFKYCRESYKKEIVHAVPSNDVEQMEQNVDRLVEWVQSYKPSSTA